MSGKVYWITGLSGAGKSTVGRKLHERLNAKETPVLLLDGDSLRRVFGNDLGYSREDRQTSAFRNARLCQFLAEQNVDVVCCTISMFDTVREWNRKNIKNYYEIYLKVPIDILVARNQKSLYSNALANITQNVVGVNQDFEEPKMSDLIIENDGSLDIDEICNMILNYNKAEGK